MCPVFTSIALGARQGQVKDQKTEENKAKRTRPKHSQLEPKYRLNAAGGRVMKSEPSTLLSRVHTATSEELACMPQRSSIITHVLSEQDKKLAQKWDFCGFFVFNKDMQFEELPANHVKDIFLQLSAESTKLKERQTTHLIGAQQF